MRNILETEINTLYLRVLVPVLVAHVLYKSCFWLYGTRCLKLYRCVSWKFLWTAWNMPTVIDICGLWLVVSHRDPSKHFRQLCYLNCLWIKMKCRLGTSKAACTWVSIWRVTRTWKRKMLGSKNSGTVAGESLCSFVSQEAHAGEDAEAGPCSR